MEPEREHAEHAEQEEQDEQRTWSCTCPQGSWLETQASAVEPMEPHFAPPARRQEPLSPRRAESDAASTSEALEEIRALEEGAVRAAAPVVDASVAAEASGAGGDALGAGAHQELAADPPQGSEALPPRSEPPPARWPGAPPVARSYPASRVPSPTPAGHELAAASRTASTDAAGRPQAPAGSGSTATAAAEADPAILALQFTCPICLEICEDCVETPCCHNLFCRQCLLSAEHRIERCPMCKSGLEAGAVVANVPVQRMISDMPCSCRFEGCGAQLSRRSRAQHEAQCSFMPVRCRFSPSCAPLLRWQLAQHEAADCPCRPIACPKECGRFVPLNCLEEHLERECPQAVCRCDHCAAPVRRTDLREHLQHCPIVRVPCGLQEQETQSRCAFCCERRHLAEHRQACAFREAACRHEGCAHVTTVRLLQDHEEHCRWRLAPCPDCGAELCLGLLQEHLETSCPEHPIACPFAAYGCEEFVLRRLVDEHLHHGAGRHLALLCSAVQARDLEIESLRAEMRRQQRDVERRLARLEQPDRRFSTGLLPPLPPGVGAPPVRLSVGADAPFPPSIELTPPPPPNELAPPPPQLRRVGGPRAMGEVPPPLRPPTPSQWPESPSAQGFAPTSSAIAGAFDMYPGTPWDQDLAIAPPMALQPLMLLREGGVSQVPVLFTSRQGRRPATSHGVPPPAGVLRRGFGVGGGVGYRTPRAPVPPSPPPFASHGVPADGATAAPQPEPSQSLGPGSSGAESSPSRASGLVAGASPPPPSDFHHSPVLDALGPAASPSEPPLPPGAPPAVPLQLGPPLSGPELPPTVPSSPAPAALNLPPPQPPASPLPATLLQQDQGDALLDAIVESEEPGSSGHTPRYM
ncbi:unnamed protein product [Prorocentrum cordatum]|uniref:RING-type E3 ubiquitin transferase n=1 Tax=Prorocentrum cordatum TaxID=2364126 RepID=A0ABN9PJ95_9DINO|nr:unnamed protein product [Polarella glacialis]